MDKASQVKELFAKHDCSEYADFAASVYAPEGEGYAAFDWSKLLPVIQLLPLLAPLLNIPATKVTAIQALIKDLQDLFS